MKRRSTPRKKSKIDKIDYSDHALNQLRLKLFNTPLSPFTIPERGRLLSDLAAIYWRRAKYDEALKIWHQLLDMYKKENDPLLIGLIYSLIATTHIHAGDGQSGLENAKKGLALMPDSIPLFAAVAYAYSAVGDHEASFEWWHKVIEKDHNFQMAYQHVATLHFRRGEYDMAERYFQRALELDASSIASLTQLANMRLTMKRYDEALVIYQKAVKTNPDDPIAHTCLANCYFHLGDIQKAQRIFERRIKMRSDDALWSNIGLGFIHRARADGKGRGRSQRYLQTALEIHGTKMSQLYAQLPLDHEARRPLILTGLDDPQVISAWQDILANPGLANLGRASFVDWLAYIRYLLQSPDPPQCTEEVIALLEPYEPEDAQSKH